MFRSRSVMERPGLTTPYAQLDPVSSSMPAAIVVIAVASRIHTATWRCGPFVLPERGLGDTLFDDGCLEGPWFLVFDWNLAPLSHAVVLNFQEVWHRSFCRTIEKLVEVVQEYPGEVEHIYSPSCVPLVRCAGCCGDDNMECHPTSTSNVTMLLLKIKPVAQGQEYVEMTFVEHQTCECRKREPTMRVERRRQRGRGKKRKERQRGKDCDRCQVPRR